MASGFIWYELLTNDADSALGFYGNLLGWTARDSGQPGMDYRILEMQGLAVGGLMSIPADARAAGMKPAWLGYVDVDDVDRTVSEGVAAGGALAMPPMDVPGVGRLAMINDPQGASLYVMKPEGVGQAMSFAPGKPGHAGWNELHTTDWQSALAFHGRLLGWTQLDAMDMGPIGKYLLFGNGASDAAPIGGMFNSPDVPPHWLTYFNVDDIDEAQSRIEAGGGVVQIAAHQVPGGDWIVQATDPQGARFALVGKRAAS